MKALFVSLILLGVMSLAKAQETPPPPTFSGQTTLCEDSYNGYKLAVPSEFQGAGKGANASWEGPKVDNFATTIFVNCTPMVGVHPQALYDGILRAKKNDRGVTEVVPVKMAGKLKGKPIYAFRCKEVPIQVGTGGPKAADDHHRWFLFVWGNDCAYELAVCGSYKALGQGQELPPVYDKVIKSFSLIPIK